MESLGWIGIEWDEGPDRGGPNGPYRQSERKEIYLEYAQLLIQHGHAYKCFCTPERLQKLRQEQKEKGLDPGYDRHCRDLDEKIIEEHERRGDASVVRLKIPLEGETSFTDMIRGRIAKQNSVLDDLVLIKSDGFPTYHLANVVDDHAMHVSHVIRGDEWISSTPRHILLYDAFGWEAPSFAHVPVILAQGGGKLSKRHGATMVQEFRERGYLNEALLNFIALLGWALDDKTEFFTLEELIAHFHIERVNKASAVFSYEKLDWFNGHYIREKSIPELYDALRPFLIKDGIISSENERNRKDYILSIVPLVQERLNHLADIKGHIWFFFEELYEIRDAETLIPKKGTKNDALQILDKTHKLLSDMKTFHRETLEESMRRLVGEIGMKVGQVFMTVRVAVTGSKVSPGLFETMEVLGRDVVLHRLQYAVKILQRMEE
jgi:glutamyl-tRNA synthetase